MGAKKNPPDPSLSPEDAQLWDQVRRSVDPLSDRPATDNKAARKAGAQGGRAKSVPSLKPAAKSPGESPAPLEGLERRLSRRIASGRAEIHSTIDLHGMTQDHAYAALVRHVEAARARGEKRILVITGKGSGSDYDLEAGRRPGVIRRALSDWLRGEDLAPHVVAFETARQRHGGSGAFYVQLRGKRQG